MLAEIGGQAERVYGTACLENGEWVVDGYKVLGVNLTTSDDAAALATFKVNNTVYNVGDTGDDDVLFYLPVTKAWIHQVALSLTLICHSSYRGVVEFMRGHSGRVHQRGRCTQPGPPVRFV